jgi:hypothetical protein
MACSWHTPATGHHIRMPSPQRHSRCGPRHAYSVAFWHTNVFTHNMLSEALAITPHGSRPWEPSWQVACAMAVNASLPPSYSLPLLFWRLHVTYCTGCCSSCSSSCATPQGPREVNPAAPIPTEAAAQQTNHHTALYSSLDTMPWQDPHAMCNHASLEVFNKSILSTLCAATDCSSQHADDMHEHSLLVHAAA